MKFISNWEKNNIKHAEIITEEGAVYSYDIWWNSSFFLSIYYFNNNIVKFFSFY